MVIDLATLKYKKSSVFHKSFFHIHIAKVFLKNKDPQKKSKTQKEG